MVDRNGNVVNSYQYDEWGNILQSTETVSNPFKYAGEVYDQETGLYYLKARYYDPSTGRFLNEDTYEGQVDNPLTLNQYAYCTNNPMIYVDPSGHKIQWNQWDDLYAGFSKTGQEILWDTVSMNFFDVWNSFTSLLGAFGDLASGDIYSFQQYFTEDCRYVMDHWYIISDDKKYGDKDISYFGSRLAGAYAELLSLGVSVAGLAEFANSSISGVSTARDFATSNGVPSSLSDAEAAAADSINMQMALQDRNMIQQVANSLKMTQDQRWEFGDYVEAYKQANGIANNATLSWKTLIALGKEFLDD